MTRRLAVAGALVLVAAGAVFARPAISRWNPRPLEDQIAREYQRAAALEDESGLVLDRIAVKESLIRELIGGRRSLIDVAARFRAMHADRPSHALVLRATYSGTTDDERIVRNVIDHAEMHVQSNENGQAIVQDLYDELDDLKRTGRLLVPGPPLDTDSAAGVNPAG